MRFTTTMHLSLGNKVTIFTIILKLFLCFKTVSILQGRFTNTHELLLIPNPILFINTGFKITCEEKSHAYSLNTHLQQFLNFPQREKVHQIKVNCFYLPHKFLSGRALNSPLESLVRGKLTF